MKKVYFNLICIAFCLIMLTSCSPKFRFVTKGLPNTDSSYIVTTKGEHIDAGEIVVRANKLTLDKKEYPFEGVSVIRSKKMYFAVNNGELYLGERYGKISILYQLKTGTEYSSNFGGSGYGGGGSSGGSSFHTVVKREYYIQKLGMPDIDKLTHSTFIDYVSDNPAALSKAKASYLWRDGSYVAGAGFAAGIIVTFIELLQSAKTTGTTPSLGTGLALAGISIPVYIITNSISNHKFNKAIKIYNQQ